MQETQPNNEPIERKTLEHLIDAFVKEQRSRRRWGIFFRSITILLFLSAFFLLFPFERGTETLTKPHAALIDVRGEIADDAEADADNIATSLREAFDNSQVTGVILRINSPGGSPVQASYIYNEINRLRKLHPKIKLYAVCTDICASGAYYIASAANRIFANPSSMVGSIGVMYDGFGFVDTMKKLGVQRRLVIIGDRKGMLDPFSPMKKEDIKSIEDMMMDTYAQFVNDVRQGRGTRLKANDPQLFSGLIWSGIQAQQLGLIDGFASAGEVARRVIGTEEVVDYTVKPNVLEKLSRRIGESFAGEMLSRMGVHQTMSLK